MHPVGLYIVPPGGRRVLPEMVRHLHVKILCQNLRGCDSQKRVWVVVVVTVVGVVVGVRSLFGCGSTTEIDVCVRLR